MSKWNKTLFVNTANMRRLWWFHSELTFFGLTDEYMEQVYEAFFTLKHYGGWSLFELYNLPIGLRTWWLERTIEEYKKEAEAVKNSSR
jgi:hypothetical protein